MAKSVDLERFQVVGGHRKINCQNLSVGLIRQADPSTQCETTWVHQNLVIGRARQFHGNSPPDISTFSPRYNAPTQPGPLCPGPVARGSV